MENENFKIINQVYENFEKNQNIENLNSKINKKQKAQKLLKDKNDNFRWDKKAFDEISIQNNFENCTPKILNQKNQENALVYKDNLLAQKSKMEFSEEQLKCLNFCISKIKPNINYVNREIVFSLYEIMNFLKLNYGNNDYKRVKESLKVLRDKSVWCKKNNGEFLFFFLQECEIEKNENNILNVKIIFSKKALELLQNLKSNFYASYLYYTNILKGKYTILFYELCKSWESKKNFILNINDLKEKWKIPKSYKNYMLKKQIIDYAISQINEKTDLYITILKTKKLNNKIMSYEIGIEKNHEAMIKNNRDFEISFIPRTN